MVGATSYLRAISQTAKQAIAAGNDIIMFSTTPALNDQVWNLLSNSMRTEEDFRQIVRASARRVLELKLTYLRGESSVPLIPDLTRVANEIPDPEGSAFFLNLAARSVTVVIPEDPETAFPLTREKAGRVLLAGRFGDFFSSGRLAFPNANVLNYAGAMDGASLVAAARNADTVILCLYDAGDLRMLRNLRNLGKQVYVVSVLSPVHIENLTWVTGAIAVYSYAPESFAAAFSAIIGRIPALGNLPYEL